MRVIITGGGTGGHIYPAVAIAERLKQDDPGIELLYVGAKHGLEKEIVPAKGIAFKTVDVAPLNRKLSVKTLGALGQTIKGIFQSRQLIKTFKPDVIIGTGGYVTGPVVLAGAMMGIPSAIHEQNAFPGMANKLLSRVVDVVMLTFEEARTQFPVKDKLVYTGLPIREAFFNTDRYEARKKLGIETDEIMILTVGGSNGAQKLNEMMMGVYAVLKPYHQLKCFHVSGNRYFERLKTGLEDGTYDVCEHFELMNFLEDMPTYLAAADIVISRAGASTITEIIATRTPSIIIPSPNVANDHQFHNAKVLDKNGMGLIVRERDLTVSLMAETIKDFIANPEKLNKMRLNCERMDIREALNRIVDAINALSFKHKD
ncbi:undecaprenyldiphospho-muramoylpentapeptide beta-N-acetylglucosaminyltransferase [Fusibacter paucivorans]|uniref:UDP-N-acetylglucosamine--N-acetylmuramyl-(pentapeptide) pyrophosphoryl-undecaprenol N-acetylglucosamine transferase n=1 Tax=Fusibacter paucivorans TaxID=76009 RepID=A0ABS5PT37_9FIRM|nr:undecaprenyldiphospho-muramoylpentapeptide beta-N-acetylglucosaminyltransferase [Fusibacter paucivorans]MBS7527539.1 undecaprenyldiphospho-muramoylpentapeptide beta-N-acetylglucosaminyltransferase [Fusibacter paucivorans]